MMYGREPVLAKKLFAQGRDVKELGFMQCPAFADQLQNVYSVSVQHNIDLEVHDDYLTSEVMPQDFFDTQLKAHSAKEKIYGFVQRTIFIAEDESLEMSQESPFLSDTRWGRDTNVIAGKLDIGKYFRALHCAFSIKQGVKKLTIDEGEPFFYLRFHTKKKIEFIPFYWSENIDHIIRNFRFTDSAYHKWKPLQFYYDIVKKKKIKKLLMKEIKKNILK